MKIEKRFIIKAFLSIPLALILYCYEVFSPPEAIEITDMFIQKVFGKITTSDSSAYILTIQNLAFVIIFNLLFSSYISEHFRYSCVYVFSRLKSRKVWFNHRVLELIIYATIYIIMFFIITLFVCIRKSTLEFQSDDIEVYMIILLFSLMITLNTTIATNLLSIKFGTITSFFVVQGVLFFLVIISLVSDHNTFLSIVNPISCLNLLTHENYMTGLMMLNNIVIFFLLYFYGKKSITCYDIALFDAEIN